jgi:small multidrug resistance pump
VNAYWPLAGAIITEIAGTLCLKASDGFSKLWPSLFVVVTYVVSFYLLAVALKLGLNIGVSYAIWSAVGTTAVAGLGVVFYKETLSPIAIGGIALIILGVIVLQLAPGSSHG